MPESKLTVVTLTTDGSCLGNPGPGGWAALLRYKAVEKILMGGDAKTTNNRMELTAVLEGLKAIKRRCNVLIVTDSKYVMDAFEKGWLEKWIENDWQTSGRQPVKNRDLWEELADLVARHEVTWEWVKGHQGHPDNEIVDEAARQSAEQMAR